MAVLLIAYDIKDDTDRQFILSLIQDMNFVRLSESAYAVNTDELPSEVYGVLEIFLGEDDVLYVITLESPWDGQGPDQTCEWLDLHL